MLRTVLITAWLLSLTAGHATASAKTGTGNTGATTQQEQDDRSGNRRVEFQIIPN